MKEEAKPKILTFLLVLLGGVLLHILPWYFGKNGIFSEFLKASGTLLVGGVATGLASELFLRRVIQREMEASLKGILSLESEKRQSLEFSGLVGVCQKLDIAGLIDRLQNGDTLWWLDTYDPMAGTWLPALKEATKKSVCAKFLVLDHQWSSVLEMRASEIAVGKGVGKKEQIDGMPAELRSFHSALDRIREKNPNNVEVRLYRDLPCAPMYLVERAGKFAFGYSGYFLLGETNPGTPHIEWQNSDKAMGAALLAYVRDKWDRWAPNSPVGDFSEAQPVGFWIYSFSPKGADYGVYGTFFIYHDGRQLRADGEAFYRGKKADRDQRRGVWRATRIEHTNATFTISYDMVIQNGHLPASESSAAKRYRGRFTFTKRKPPLDSSLTDHIVEGNIYSDGTKDVHGRVVATRLKSSKNMPDKDDFANTLGMLFEKGLGVKILQSPSLSDVTPAPKEVLSRL